MYKQRLKEYIEEDEIYQDYKHGIEPAHNDGNTDFEWFCIQHCQDIENLLNEVEELKLEKKALINNYLLMRTKNKTRKRRYKQKVHDAREKRDNLQVRIDKVIRMLEINIEITKQQPSNNKLEDEFFINRCNDLLKILKGDVDE